MREVLSVDWGAYERGTLTVLALVVGGAVWGAVRLIRRRR